MYLPVRQLELEPIRFNESYPPGAVDFFDPQLRQATPILASGIAELSRTLMEIRVRGHLSTTVEDPCDRCLEPVSFVIDTDFDLVYRPAEQIPEHEEMNIPESESEVGFYEGEGLDLADVVREQILLSLPMHRLCSGDCKGICPVCGQNRNNIDCNCQAEAGDDRWAGLKQM